MGTVYRALDPVLERTVAIKTLNADLDRDELLDLLGLVDVVPRAEQRSFVAEARPLPLGRGARRYAREQPGHEDCQCLLHCVSPENCRMGKNPILDTRACAVVVGA